MFESFKTDQAQPMQRLVAPLARGDAANGKWKLDIAERGEPRKQIAVLRDVADAGVQSVHRCAIVEHGPAGRAKQARRQSQQGGLAATGRSDDGRDLSGQHVEADAVQREHVVILTGKDQLHVRKADRRLLGIVHGVAHECPCIATLWRHSIRR